MTILSVCSPLKIISNQAIASTWLVWKKQAQKLLALLVSVTIALLIWVFMSTHIAICRRYLLKCDSWCAVIKCVSLSLFQAYSKGSWSKWVAFISSFTISDSPGESRSNECYWYFRATCTHCLLILFKTHACFCSCSCTC